MAISVFVVLLMVAPTSTVGSAPSKGPTTATTAPSENATSFAPYLVAPSSFPAPDLLPNVTGVLSLPQISSISIGDAFVYALVFVDQTPQFGNELEFDTGTYNATLADSIALNGCALNCSDYLPIAWNGATPIAVYGTNPIQSDTLVVTSPSYAGNQRIFVGAASNNSTMVYVSSDFGAPGSWSDVSTTPIRGGDPRIDVAIDSCAITVVTQGIDATYVWTAQQCLNTVAGVDSPSSISMVPALAGPPDQGGMSLAATSARESGISPAVTGVVPQVAESGQLITVLGSGFSNVASVRVGTTAAAYNRISATQLSVRMPPGAGFQNVRVLEGGVWTSATCADQVGWGTNFTAGDPEIFDLSLNATTAGATITIAGLNFTTTDRVWFGSVEDSTANVTFVNSTSLKVIVPKGSGTVYVSVTGTAPLKSPSTCADVFHYDSVYLYSLSPTTGAQPLNVLLSGVGFTSSASVYFGSTEANSTFVSSTELIAALPKGSGTVQVDVHQGSTTTDKVPFVYAVVGPDVSALAPSQGPKGTTVTVYGSNFNSTAMVHFGSKNATAVVDNTTTELTAVAPSTSGTVNVTVIQDKFSSPTVCSDQYVYGSALAKGLPQILSLSSPAGESGANITVNGVNLSTSDTVLFGGLPALSLTSSLSNSTALDVRVPLGFGNVSVQVESSSGNSPATCNARFTIVSPGSQFQSLGWTPEGQAVLPGSLEAVPLTLPQPYTASSSETGGLYGGLGYGAYGTYVFATLPNGTLSVYWNSAVNGPTWSRENLTTFGTTLGSAALDAIGDTAESIPGGVPGQLAISPDGSGVLLLLTSDEDGRTDLATYVSPELTGTAGSSPVFNGSTYLTTPVAGSASDPQVAAAPYAGDYYATWLENGVGPARVDEAVVGASGVVIQNPGVVTGSGGSGSGNASAADASLAVNPLGQPLVVWSWATGPAMGDVAFTGQYLDPQTLIGYLGTAWSNLTKPDFQDLGGTSYSSFKSKVAASMNDIATDLSGGNLCGAQQNASSIYTNDTWDDSPPILPGPALPHCVVPTAHGHPTLLIDGTGTLDASFYLGVETDWLYESLGVGTMGIPDWSGAISPVPSSGKVYVPDAGTTATDARGDIVEIAPDTTTVNTVWLDTTAIFPSTSTSSVLVNATGVPCGTLVEQDSVVKVSETASIRDSQHSAHGTFNTTGVPASPVFVNLETGDNGTWTSTLTLTFQTVEYVTNHGCGSGAPASGTRTVKTPPPGWPTAEVFSLSGNFTTGLDPFPYAVPVVETHSASGSTSSYTVSWENTVNSTAQLWLNGTCGTKGKCNATWSDTTPSEYDTASGSGTAGAPNPLGSISLRLGATNRSATTSSWPQVNVGEVSSPSAGSGYSESCKTSPIPKVGIWISGKSGVSNLTSDRATFTWYSNQTSLETAAWARLTGATGGPLNVTAQMLVLTNGSTENIAEASGLDSWQFYSVEFYSELSIGCKIGTATVANVSEIVSLSGGQFQVPGVPLLFEQDLPYDSITQQGGGAIIAWEVPLSFEDHPGTTFENGTLTLTIPKNASAGTLVLPIRAPLIPFTNYSEFSENVQNLSANTYAVDVPAQALVLNSAYRAVLFLNYTTSSTTKVSASGSLNFTYEKDTSGDGLTDWEKTYGWYVTTLNVNGQSVVQHVTANVNDYSTNGLVGDYVEKLYGLNPTTVDSAGSHMLDTYNLTFLLPNNNSTKHTNVQYVVDTSYDPICGGGGGLKSLPDVSMGPASGAGCIQASPYIPSTWGTQTNLTPSRGGGIYSGDGSPWASTVVWSYQAFQAFESLPGVIAAGWLRATEGFCQNYTLVTIWGKLSWGADPLSASTPNDGIIDGSRVNPVTNEALMMSVSNLQTSGLSSGQGWAVEFSLYTGSSHSGTPVLKNFTASGGLSGDPSSVDYSTTLPVSQISATDTLSVQVVANKTGSSSLTPIAFNYTYNSTTKLYSVSYEMNLTYSIADGVNGAVLSEAYSISSAEANPSATFSILLQTVPVGGKAPTYLWLPSNGGTTNGLPPGLDRYTGEQSFELVLVNSSASISSVSVPTSTGGSFSVSLEPGLNNLLVPREQFVASPLGQAVYEGVATYAASNMSVPAVLSEDGQAQSVLTGMFGSAVGLGYELGAYWQDLSIAPGSGSGTFGSVTEPGTSNSSSQQVRELAVTSAASNNSGGLASDPALYESTLSAPPAVIGMVTLNVSTVAGLDLLLAGLVDNTTGGVNGTIQNVTSEVPTLGFNGAVLGALANAVVSTDPLYGAPTFIPPPPKPKSSIWGDFVNAVTDVVQTVSGAIKTLAAIVWTAAVQAFTYIDHLAIEAAALVGQLLSRAAAALIQVGKDIVSAVVACLNFIVSLVTSALSAAFRPIVSACKAFGLAVANSLAPAVSDVTSGNGVTEAHAAEFWDTLLGGLFIAGVAIAAAVEIVIGILTPFTLGLTFLLPLVIGALLAAALQALESTPKAHVASPSGITAFNSDAIYTCEGAVNSTNPPPENQSNWTTDWNALAGVCDWTASLLGTQLGLGLLAAAYYEGKGIALSAVGFGLALVSLGLGIAGAADGNRLVQETNVGVSLTSVALDLVDLGLYPEERVGPIGVLNYLTLGLDAVSTTIGVAELLTEG